MSASAPTTVETTTVETTTVETPAVETTTVETPAVETTTVVNYVLTGRALTTIVETMSEAVENENVAMRSEFDRTVGDAVKIGRMMVKIVKPFADAAGVAWVASTIVAAMSDPTSVLFIPADDRAKFVSTSVLSRAFDFARLEPTPVGRSRSKFLAKNRPDAKFYLTALKIDAGEKLGNRDTTDVAHYKLTGVIRKTPATPAVITPNADDAKTTTTTVETPAATTTTVETTTVETPAAPAIVRPWSDVESMDAAGLAAILATPAVNLAAIPAVKRVAVIRTLMAAVMIDEMAAVPAVDEPITLDVTV